MSVISRHGQRAFDGRPVCDRVGGPELCRAAIGGSGVNPEVKETPAPAEPTGVQQSSAESPGLSHPTDESAARDEQAAINRSLFMMQDHLAELDARLARLEPLLRAGSLARTGLRRLAGILRFPLKLAALILHWRETGRRIKDARFRSERLVFDSSRSVFMRRVDFPAFAGHLRRSFGFFPPAVYRVRAPPEARSCPAAESSARDCECLDRRLNAAYRRSSQPSWAPLRNDGRDIRLACPWFSRRHGDRCRAKTQFPSSCAMYIQPLPAAHRACPLLGRRGRTLVQNDFRDRG